MSIVQTNPALQPIRNQYVDGMTNKVDIANGVSIGATVALTSLGRLIFPSQCFPDTNFPDVREVRAFCAGRYTNATNKRFQLILDGAATVFDATIAVAISPAEFYIEARLSKLFPGGVMVQADITLDIAEAAAGSVPQRLTSAFFLPSSSTFDIPPSEMHSLEFFGAKNAVGDVFDSFYSYAISR